MKNYPQWLGIGFLFMFLVSCQDSENQILIGMAETREIVVASKLSGRLALVSVSEGDRVEEGQEVATLASPEVGAKVEQAKGALKSAEARLQLMRRGVRPEELRMAQTVVAQAKEARQLAESTWNRIKKLYADSAVTRQQADEAEYKWRSAQESEFAAESRVEMLKSGARPEEIEAGEGATQSARNALLEAASWSKETAILSPVGGVVQKRYLGAGEIAAAGAPILVLIQPEATWVVLPVREDQIVNYKLGRLVHGDIPALGLQGIGFKVVWQTAMGDFATWRSTSRRGDADLRSFEVRLEPEGPVEGFLPGMTVRFLVPLNASRAP
jgi:HlyD family secretion protein